MVKGESRSGKRTKQYYSAYRGTECPSPVPVVEFLGQRDSIELVLKSKQEKVCA